MSRLLSLIYSCLHVLALPWVLDRLGSADGRRSLLARLGLEFFSASTPDEYVAKAVALAAKPQALAKIKIARDGWI